MVIITNAGECQILRGGGGCPWTGSDGFAWIFLKNLDENASTHVEFWQLSARKGSIFTVVID